MQNRALQHWSIVLLLIARLVLGELAHAMPHTSAGSHEQEPVATEAQEAPCPDHAEEPSEAPISTDSADTTGETHGNDSHDSHCCQNSCDCACLHLSPLAVSTVAVNSSLQEHLVPTDALGQTPHRSSRLFRPPA